jgi:hypothetical protein
MAGYHQFHAVQVAVAETLRAAELRREADRVAEVTGGYEAGRRPGGKPPDRRIGVVWHTQGSGKSLTMAFYAGRDGEAKAGLNLSAWGCNPWGRQDGGSPRTDHAMNRARRRSTIC